MADVNYECFLAKIINSSVYLSLSAILILIIISNGIFDQSNIPDHNNICGLICFTEYEKELYLCHTSLFSDIITTFGFAVVLFIENQYSKKQTNIKMKRKLTLFACLVCAMAFAISLFSSLYNILVVLLNIKSHSKEIYNLGLSLINIAELFFWVFIHHTQIKRLEYLLWVTSNQRCNSSTVPLLPFS